MARREITVTIDAEGRDKGKRFRIREMPASQAERWAIRAFLALAHAGVPVPDDFQDAGMAGMAYMGVQALSGLSFEDAAPLLDEMFECIEYQADAKVTRPLEEDDIEEVGTRLRLRSEVFELHTGFSMAGALSRPASKTDQDASPSAIQTSPQTSQQ